MKISPANRMKLAHFLTRDADEFSRKIPYAERFANRLNNLDFSDVALAVTKFREAGREIQKLEWKIDNLITELTRKKEFANPACPVSAVEKELAEVEVLKAQVEKAVVTEQELRELCALFFGEPLYRDSLAAWRENGGDEDCYLTVCNLIEAGYNPMPFVKKLESEWVCILCEECGHPLEDECQCATYGYHCDPEEYCFYEDY